MIDLYLIVSFKDPMYTDLYTSDSINLILFQYGGILLESNDSKKV